MGKFIVFVIGLFFPPFLILLLFADWEEKREAKVMREEELIQAIKELKR